MHHAQQKKLMIRNERHTVVHNRARLLRYTDIPGLFSEFAYGALLGSFTGIDKASRNFDNNHVNWRPILLLKKQFWPTRHVQDSNDPHTVDLSRSRTSLVERRQSRSFSDLQVTQRARRGDNVVVHFRK